MKEKRKQGMERGQGEQDHQMNGLSRDHFQTCTRSGHPREKIHVKRFLGGSLLLSGDLSCQEKKAGGRGTSVVKGERGNAEQKETSAEENQKFEKGGGVGGGMHLESTPQKNKRRRKRLL